MGKIWSDVWNYRCTAALVLIGHRGCNSALTLRVFTRTPSLTEVKLKMHDIFIACTKYLNFRTLFFCEKLFLLWKAWNLKVNSPSEIMYTDMSDHWHIYIETWKVVKKTSGAMHTALSNHWHFWIISELLLQDRLWEFKTELEIRCLRCLRIHRNKTMADHDHGHEEGKLHLKLEKSFKNLDK